MVYFEHLAQPVAVVFLISTEPDVSPRLVRPSLAPNQMCSPAFARCRPDRRAARGIPPPETAGVLHIIF